MEMQNKVLSEVDQAEPEKCLKIHIRTDGSLFRLKSAKRSLIAPSNLNLIEQHVNLTEIFIKHRHRRLLVTTFLTFRVVDGGL